MNKTQIYYFSGTGNSLYVAKEMQKRMPGTELIPMIRLLNEDVIETNGKTVGFVFPIYISSVPAPVKKFLKKLEPGSADYIFLAVTCGGFPSPVNIYLDNLLKTKNKKLDSYFVFDMIQNTPTGLKPAFMADMNWSRNITGEKIKAIEASLKDKLDTAADTVMKNKKNTSTGKKRFLEKLAYTMMYPLEKAGEGLTKDIKFYADTDCSGCGICKKVCLSGKVEMTGKKPVWQKDIRCFYCYACFNSCPSQSILVEKTYTLKTGRYIHPGITAEDIALQK